MFQTQWFPFAIKENNWWPRERNEPGSLAHAGLNKEPSLTPCLKQDGLRPVTSVYTIKLCKATATAPMALWYFYNPKSWDYDLNHL